MSVLNNIFGSGGILSAVMSIASMVFPPMAIMSSLTNLVTQALGTALKAGIDVLAKEFGMPKFVADIAKGAIDQAVGANQKQTDPAADQAVKEQAGDKVKNWGDELMKDFIEKVLDKVKKGGADKKPEGGEKVSAGSWLEAIAVAMAESMSAKASKMIDLSTKIKELSSATAPKGLDEKGEAAWQKKNAGELNVANAQMGAAGKEYELLTNTMKTIVDSIGNAMAQAARKS